MPQKMVVVDDALSFYRYLVVSKRDRNWGLFVTGTGHEIMTLASPAAGLAKPYPYSWTSSDDDRVSITWDPRYPVRYRNDWNQGRTFVDEFSLLYFDSGASWTLETDATQGAIPIQPGSVLLLFPGVWHRYRPELDATNKFSSTLWCTFGGNFARQWQKSGLISPRHPVHYVGGSPALACGFRRMHNFLGTCQPAALQQSLAGGLLELIGNADAASRSATEPNLSPDLIQQAKAVLEDVVAPEAVPQRVSRALNVPYDRFRRSFKVATGLSPHQYRMQSLIRHAKELLESTDLSIKEIGAAVHFSDQHYFAKAFKHKVGVTPSEWRMRSRHKNGPRGGRSSSA